MTKVETRCNTYVTVLVQTCGTVRTTCYGEWLTSDNIVFFLSYSLHQVSRC